MLQDRASSGVFFIINKPALPLVDFKMNVIKWKLHFVSYNFGLKSNLITRVITRLISDQIARHSVQIPCIINLISEN